MATSAAPSPPHIDLWLGDELTFGSEGEPQRWVNVLGRVKAEAGLYDLRWYRNDDMGSVPLSVGPSPYRLNGAGDFNIEIDRESLPVGVSKIIIEAVDLQVQVTRRTVMIHRQVGQRAPWPFHLDPSKPEHANRFQVVDGHWERTADGIRVVELGYDRVLAFGDMDWANFRIDGTLTIDRFSDHPLHYEANNSGAWVGFVALWQGHHDWGDLIPRRGWHPYGVIANCELKPRFDAPILRLMGNKFQAIEEGKQPWPVGLGKPFHLAAEARCQSDALNHYRMKIWPKGGAEPEDWVLQGNGKPDELKAGSVCFVAHNCEATLHEVTVKPLEA